MGDFRCKVEVVDVDGHVLASEYAYGNTYRTCYAAASALRKALEREHEEDDPLSHARHGRVEQVTA